MGLGVDLRSTLVIILCVSGLALIVFRQNEDGEEAEPDVHKWLKEMDFEAISPLFKKVGVKRLIQVAVINDIPTKAEIFGRLDTEDQERLVKNVERLKDNLILYRWLWKNRYEHLHDPLIRIGVKSLVDLSEYAEDDETRVKMLSHFQGNVPDLINAKHLLPRNKEAILKLKMSMAQQLVYEANIKKDEDPGSSVRDRFFKFMVTMVSIGIGFLLWDLGVTPNDLIVGLPLHKQRTKIIWPENMTASNTITMKVKFYTFQGNQIEDILKKVHPSDVKAIVVHSTGRNVESSIAEQVSSEISIIFSGRLAGHYSVTLTIKGNVVRGFPSGKTILAGDPHPPSITLPGLRSKTLVARTRQSDVTTFNLEVRDKFGNILDSQVDLPSRFSIGLDDERTSDDLFNALFYYNPTNPNQVSLSMVFCQGHQGWFKLQINFDGQPIAEKNLSVLVLNNQDILEVERVLGNHSNGSISFEAEILLEKKPKTVYTYITPKQLVIKDYILKFIPRRLHTFRLTPATKIDLVTFEGFNPVLKISDGSQTCPKIRFKNGMVFLAAYHLSLLKRMGGSLSFTDKQKVFNARLIKYHESKGHRHVWLPLTIDRSNFLGSSLKAMRWFNDGDWCRLFGISFEGEPGIDNGGVRREWFEILCKKLFHPSTGIFSQTEEGSEAIHPNPSAESSSNKKLYNFAGKLVGKCLLESAYGDTYRQLFPPRLAMSFLAQMVGLRVRYQHFADDSPQYYTSKIYYLLNQSLDEECGLEDLYFVEEEYNGNNCKIVDLKPNGSRIKVTESNKLEYLDCLAQYRLCDKFKEQTDLFLEGLYTIVPETLLSAFDESELELLLCGLREYDLKDWQQHCTIVRDGYLTNQSVQWFWIAVSNFTPEQHAKLLRFSTGSSQLPPGGFSELKPIFQVSGMERRNVLPTSHTCFNMICLSEHDRYEGFEKALFTAIEEGCEGFGLI